MTVTRGHSTVLLAVAFGALAGTASSLALRRATKAHEDPAPAEGAPVAEGPRVTSAILAPAAGEGTARVAQLEERLARLEASDAGAAPAPPDPPSRAEYEARHAAHLEAHEREAVDRAWAPATARMLQTDFDDMAKQAHFEVQNVDCRMTTCAVRVAWGSPEEAKAHYRDILRRPFQAACAREVLVQEEPGPGGTSQATAIFDCTDWRASGSEPMRIAPVAPAAVE